MPKIDREPHPPEIRRIDLYRQPGFSGTSGAIVERHPEAFRHDATDEAGRTAHANHLADDVGPCSELSHPEGMAEDDRRLGTGRGVAGLEADTARGLHLQRVEQVHADRRNSHAVGIAAICERRVCLDVSSHVLQTPRAFSVPEELSK